MKIKILVTIIMLLSAGMVFGQSFDARGVVVDGNGTPLVGVTVIQTGTSKGTVTGAKGEFEIRVSRNAMLQFSYVGYQTQTLKASGDMVVKLQEQSADLEEVVVVGYGYIKKSDLTSSIAVVKGEELQKSMASSALNALQGKVAGVQITNTSGAPGSSPSVLIRGVTTQNGSAPLYVVDGIPGVNINLINQSDIKSIEVLKDAASTSIYGARGSNGVILVTTNRGAFNQKTEFTLNLKQGFQVIPKPDMASAAEYTEIYNARFINDGSPVPYGWDGTETDWWDLCVRDFASVSDMNLGFTGGTEKFAYNGSISYFNQTSQIKEGGYWRRISARFNTEYKFSDKIKFGQDFAPSYRTTESYNNVMGNAMQYDPTQALYRPKEEWDDVNEFSIYGHSDKTSVPNPYAAMKRSIGESRRFYLLTNSFLAYEPVRNLVFRTQFGIDATFDYSKSFSPDFYMAPTEQLETNSISSGQSWALNWTWNNTVNYNFAVGKSSFAAMAGFVMEKTSSLNISGSKDGIPNSYNEDLRYLNAGTINPQVSGGESDAAIMSFLARVQYNYDKRFFLTATYRVDGSSKFIGDNKYAHFPSVSAAYNFKQDNWLKDSRVVSALRLRAGWGRVGNQNIPSGAYENKIASVATVLGNDMIIGSSSTSIANKSIKWEVVEDYNVGIELGLFNKLNLTVEAFDKTSHDMLMQARNLLFSGYPTADAKMWTNIGSMKAKGLEFVINYRNFDRAFKYDLSFNASRIHNTAEKLVYNEPQYNGSFLSQTTHKTEPGSEIGRFFLFECDGIFKNWEEINAHTDEHGNFIQPNAQPGDLRFVDQNKDGVLDEKDKIYAGSGLPKWTYGLSGYFEYKGFDLSFNVIGNIGNKIFNSNLQRLHSGYAGVNVMKGLSDKVWTPENPNASIPRLSVNDLNDNFKRPSTYFMEDGDFLRMQNLQFGYNFKVRGVGFRAYVSAQNLFTITGYSGQDVEAASGGNVLSSGIDWFPYAQPRVYVIGLNLQF